MKKLPKRLYIWRENPNSDNEYLATSTEIAESISGKSPEIVGIYKLQETIRVDKKIVVTSLSGKKKKTKA